MHSYRGDGAITDFEHQARFRCRVVENQGLMDERQDLCRVCEASGVTASHVVVGHVVTALSYALAD